MSSLSKLPEVLSQCRGHVISDATFWNQFEDDHLTPVLVREVTGIGVDNTKLNSAKVTSLANPKKMDVAKLEPDAVGLIVKFQLSYLPLAGMSSKTSGTNSHELKTMQKKFIDSALQSDGLVELSRRISRNILSGRWLWRNRSVAKSVSVTVTSAESKIHVANALALPLNNFDDYLPEEKELAAIIQHQLQGTNEDELAVSALVTQRATGSVEVYPSQEYIDKPKDPKGMKGKYLYTLNKRIKNADDSVVGEAALRDHKIANALRTIDNWYSDDPNPRPIPVEFYGANIEDQTFYRKGSRNSGVNALQLMKQVDKVDPNSREGMFLLACFLRGGVYA